MIHKLMSLIDLFSAIAVLLVHFGVFEAKIMTYLIIFLVLKTIGFWGDFASIIDGVCAAYMLLMFTGFTCFISFFVAIWLGQKAIFGLLM
jgi:hypothetical protein